MTYKDFRNKYNEKYVDYDGAHGAQCWDLGQQYITECLKLPAYILSGSGLVSNMLKEPKRSVLLSYFDEVPMTAMTQGDIVIWEYGHIAIFDSWDGKSCWYFSQNVGSASKPKGPSVIKVINRSGGHAFRVKVKNVEPLVTEQEPYDVKIIASVLNIRENHNASSKIKGSLLKDQIVTINAICDNWGRLSDGRGWISLSYAEKNVIEVLESPIELEKTQELPIITPEEQNNPIEEQLPQNDELVEEKENLQPKPQEETTKPKRNILKELIELIINFIRRKLWK